MFITDLLALAETISSGNLRCEVCRCNVVLRDPDDPRNLTLVDAHVWEGEDGGYVARCTGC